MNSGYALAAIVSRRARVLVEPANVLSGYSHASNFPRGLLAVAGVLILRKPGNVLFRLSEADGLSVFPRFSGVFGVAKAPDFIFGGGIPIMNMPKFAACTIVLSLGITHPICIHLNHIPIGVEKVGLRIAGGTIAVHEQARWVVVCCVFSEPILDKSHNGRLKILDANCKMSVIVVYHRLGAKRAFWVERDVNLTVSNRKPCARYAKWRPLDFFKSERITIESARTFQIGRQNCQMMKNGQLDLEIGKALILINGAGIIALLTFLSSIFDSDRYPSFGKPAMIGVVILVGGLLSALAYIRFGRKCSLIYEQNAMRSPVRPLACRISEWMMCLSGFAFGATALYVGFSWWKLF